MTIVGAVEVKGGLNLISAAWQCAVMTTAAVVASKIDFMFAFSAVLFRSFRLRPSWVPHRTGTLLQPLGDQHQAGAVPHEHVDRTTPRRLTPGKEMLRA